MKSASNLGNICPTSQHALLQQGSPLHTECRAPHNALALICFPGELITLPLPATSLGCSCEKVGGWAAATGSLPSSYTAWPGFSSLCSPSKNGLGRDPPQASPDRHQPPRMAWQGRERAAERGKLLLRAGGRWERGRLPRGAAQLRALVTSVRGAVVVAGRGFMSLDSSMTLPLWTVFAVFVHAAHPQ